jgi:Ricin-type beta-trefoil lectin domain
VPFPGRERKSAHAAGGRFAAMFARHPARPRRGLLPGRRVWATIFGAAVVAAACVLVTPLIASIYFGTSTEPKARTVAERAGAAWNSARPVISSSPSPRKTPKPSPSVRTARKRPAVPAAKPGTTAPSGARKKASKALPRGARFSTVTGVLIKNKVTGFCVDIPGYGPGMVDGPVQAGACNGSNKDNQRWDLVVRQKGAGPNGADLFVVRNAKDGYCLDLPNYGPAETSSHVTEWYCHPGSVDNQMWYLTKKSASEFWIRNMASRGECLDVAGDPGSEALNAPLTIFPCSLNDDHLWSFS